MNGFEFYQLTHSLKLHFTKESYDVMKSGRGRKLKYETFLARKDANKFEYFANKFVNSIKAGQFVIANIISDNANFMYGTYDDANDIFLQWKKVRESLTNEFTKDIATLNTLVDEKNINLFNLTPKGYAPPLLQLALAKKINVESVVLLNKEHHEFFDNWQKICENDPYMNDVVLMYRKYQPFVVYDPDKIQSVIKEARF